MRFRLLSVLLCVSTLGYGQGGNGGSLFLTTRFDGAVVVSKSRTGADLVEVTILKPTYSQELLRKQIELLGAELGSEPRGIDIGHVGVGSADPSSATVRAHFAVDGLIDRANGTLHLQALARGFSLLQGPDKLDALMVQFQRETPTPATLRSCGPPQAGCAGAMVEGRAEGPVLGIEYRIKLLTHDPASIRIPDSPKDAVVAPKPVAPPKKATDWTGAFLIVLGAGGAGALVYSLLTGSRRRNGPRGRGGSSGPLRTRPRSRSVSPFV